MLTGLIGKKIGMTQMTDAAGRVRAATRVDARSMHRLPVKDRGD